MSAHPWATLGTRKKVSITGASRLRECKNTEFEWELSKRGFVKVGVSRAVHLREGPLGELPRINLCC